MQSKALFLRFLAALPLFILVHSSHSRTRHQRHTHHKFPDANVTVGLQSNPEDAGPWSQWGESSECTRTCGGGVAFQTRTCLLAGSAVSSACVGPSKRFISCNIQDCPDGSRDFREEQCAKFDTIPFGGKFFHWIPYQKGFNECELNCMPKGGDKFYYRHSQAVVDGTRCREDSMDICIQGVCMAVGCDLMLGSNVKEDKCQECGGDGSNCKTVEGIFDQTNLQVGYNDILLIPVGATTIKIRELEPTNNYLAIRNSSGHYYLNGNWQIEFPRTLKFAGTYFYYERIPKSYVGLEYIHAPGPTTEPIFISLLYQQRNLGVSYEYSVPLGVSQQTQSDGYVWVYSNFGACSKSCGGGLQSRSVNCGTTTSYEIVADYLCDSATKPPENQTCHLHPCPAQWKVGEWDECSKPCGSGVQYRQVHCLRDHDDMAVMVHDSECSHRGAKPVYARTCNDNPCSGPVSDWRVGEWSACNEECGEGLQTREVECVMRVEGQEKIISEEYCKSEEPESAKSCLLKECDGMEWVVSDWSGCEGICSLSMESRLAFCASQSGRIHDEHACVGEHKPTLTRHCSNHRHCEKMWHASEWSECSSKCGEGTKTRTVFCGSWKDGEIHQLPDDDCPNDTKMETEASCLEMKCVGNWFTGPWSRCSAPCGGGKQRRKVMCLLHQLPMSHEKCDVHLQPFDAQSCNQHPCDEDEIIIVGGCHKSKHGCCSDGMTPAPGPNLERCPKEVGHQCKKSEFGCCSDGVTPAMGLFGKGCAKSMHCNDTQYGCCPDGITPATSVSKIECFDDCDNSLWGCCPDGITPATGRDNHGCSSSSKVMCKSSPHGCCPDGFTPAIGPDNLGCDLDESSGEDCYYSTHGCCPDGITSAKGEDMLGCPKEDAVAKLNCKDSTYGCCLDGETPAQGPDLSGCFEGSGDMGNDCQNTLHGCCPDNITPAKGENFAGCSMPSKKEDTSCHHHRYGCCKDGKSLAHGPNYLGCRETESSPCANTLFGCCFDGSTPAQGPSKYGCCLAAQFGCCPDNITVATGPYHGGCPCHTYPHGCCLDGKTIAKGPRFEGCSCDHSTHGCCQDGSTYARGPNFEGCDCQSAPHGCCPDGATSAMGPNGKGCGDCHSMKFGCCPNGQMAATGPNYGGCPCKTYQFGCCPDGITPAMGPDGKGCADCHNSPFGCCPNGQMAATGHNNEGCPCKTFHFGCCPAGITPAMGPDSKGCADCHNTPFGCCPNGQMAATGHNNEGCPCKTFHFGCCPDGITPAMGPDGKGCADCHNSPFGCCPNGQMAATGHNNEGCPCKTLHFGCCPDGITPAMGPDSKGCADCHNTPFGCCPNGQMAATGHNNEGCPCKTFHFGCCPDGITPAMGPDGKGCTDCHEMRFGCCPDGTMPATGYNYDGCPCKTYLYGCCPDGLTPAKGPNPEDCPCEAMTHGCCPDHKTSAKGPYNEGCPCSSMLHGCCPDNQTAASGPNHQGCPCMSTPFGCCPDKHRIATGPNFHGCPCQTLVHGCCPDFKTAARGPGYEGCSCNTFPYGCCPDGVTPARDSYFGGCKGHKKDHTNLVTSDVCNMHKERGPCHNFTVKWYFDVTYGGCSRFWYGGCDGNGNQFNSQEECEQVCVNPEGHEACMLPKVVGPCKSAHQSWYYESETDSCKSFNYSGCLGNNNRYKSKEICESTCVRQSVLDACDQSMDVGPCKKVAQRWFFNKVENNCKPFIFGGCKGNHNNFETEKECMQRCVIARPKEPMTTLYNATIGSHVTMVCKAMPTIPSDEAVLYLWYKGDSAYPIHGTDLRDTEEKTPIASRGTDPRFSVQEGDHLTALTIHKIRKEDEGQYRCRVDFRVGSTVNKFMKLAVVEPNTCHLPQLIGNCYHFRERWFYNLNDRKCQRFYYSGCGGNDNNFGTLLECEKQCHKAGDKSSLEDFSLEFCSFEPDSGPCAGRKVQWFYDKDGVCKQFYYGGCKGNGNRFNTKKECESRCAASQDVCNLPKIRGPCSGSFHQWYYDSEHKECREFVFSGCQGNGNRFNDKETCQIQCTNFPSISSRLTEEPCSQQKDPGPCLGYFLMWYHDADESACKTFIYGGCLGNENRFSNLQDCEARCHTNNAYPMRRAKLTQPSIAPATFITNEEICRQPADEGHCEYSQNRFYYDPQKTMCLQFVYKGCGGNKNRFKTADLCMRFCSDVQGPAAVGDAAVREVPPLEERNCPISNCYQLQCPHGVEEVLDIRGCISCLCSNPCENHECPHGSQCVVEKRRKDGDFVSMPLCRQKIKSGKCPDTTESEHLLNGTCHDRCQSDAECPNSMKCCFVTCAKMCMSPSLPDTFEEDHENAVEDEDITAPPQILSARKDIAVKKGTPALLRCIVKGYPPPRVTWHHKNHPLNPEGGEYKISPDGSLHIMSVDETHEGMYTCTAENGVGAPVTRFFNLIVYVDTTANITIATPSYKVGSPLQLDCKVVGTQPIVVTWHLGQNSAPLEPNDHREIWANHTLYIDSAQYNDTGLYVCEAQNQHGKAVASVDIRIHDISIPSTCKDSPFFTSCAMIVTQKYCINPTYAKFCCMSCAISGQLRRTEETTTFSDI